MKYILQAIILIFLWMPSALADQACLGSEGNKNMFLDDKDKNVLGEKLELCCSDSVTGFYRNGYCQTDRQDVGKHIVCAQVTQEFLDFSKAQGNDLVTPHPDHNFAGLKSGDKWCLCADRWIQALEAGVAPPMILEATHQKMLESTEIEVLKKYALNRDEPLKQSRANAYQFSFKSIDGEDMLLSDFRGKAVLIVNTASQCGFTKQYKDLQTLYELYKDQGLVVIGVPCNDFGKQEPGDLETIKNFTQKQYGVTFPLTQKYSVKGNDAHPFFKWAEDQKKGALFQSSPKWNFHKFLIDTKGDLVKSYGSQVNPSSVKIREEIERILKRD